MDVAGSAASGSVDPNAGTPDDATGASASLFVLLGTRLTPESNRFFRDRAAVGRAAAFPGAFGAARFFGTAPLVAEDGTVFVFPTATGSTDAPARLFVRLGNRFTPVSDRLFRVGAAAGSAAPFGAGFATVRTSAEISPEVEVGFLRSRVPVDFTESARPLGRAVPPLSPFFRSSFLCSSAAAANVRPAETTLRTIGEFRNDAIFETVEGSLPSEADDVLLVSCWLDEFAVVRRLTCPPACFGRPCASSSRFLRHSRLRQRG